MSSRPVSSFFLGSLFFVCVHSLATAIISSCLLGRILFRRRPITLEDGLGLAADLDSGPRPSRINSWLVMATHRIDIPLAFCLGTSCLGQLGSLMSFTSSAGKTGCGELISLTRFTEAWNLTIRLVTSVTIGGLFGRLAGIFALIAVGQELRHSSPTVWELRALLLFSAALVRKSRHDHCRPIHVNH